MTTGLLCGAVLGLRCRIAVLVPAHAIAVVVLVVAGVTGTWSAGRLVVGALAWSLGCQGGYLAGAIAQAVGRPAGRRAPPDRPPF